MTPEEQYDELLKMADAMENEGLITGAEWRQLIRDAGAAFTHVREGLEGGPRVCKEKPELGEHGLKNHEGAERNL
jgi:hypothetical protein